MAVDRPRGHKKRRTLADAKGRKGRVCLLVLLGFLLDITDFLRNLLQGVFVSAILQLEIWSPSEAGLATGGASSPHLAVSLPMPVAPP